MKNWWKNPVLQGEDNDYGQYDYLIEELPHDEASGNGITESVILAGNIIG